MYVGCSFYNPFSPKDFKYKWKKKLENGETEALRDQGSHWQRTRSKSRLHPVLCPWTTKYLCMICKCVINEPNDSKSNLKTHFSITPQGGQELFSICQKMSCVERSISVAYKICFFTIPYLLMMLWKMSWNTTFFYKKVGISACWWVVDSDLR